MKGKTGWFDARYYDLIYGDKDYEAESAYVDALLRRHSVTGMDLLEFGSGTGRHGRLLAERGYRVTGIERNEEMVARATVVKGFTSQQGDIRTVRLVRTFDAVLALFHVVSFQVSNADVQAVFARAAEHLQTSGLFLFDVWYSPAVYSRGLEVRVKRLTDGDLEITRIAEPVAHHNENHVDVCYTIYIHNRVDGSFSSVTELHPLRHYSLPELDLLASGAGFVRVAAEEFLTGKASGEDTWGVCLVFRKA